MSVVTRYPASFISSPTFSPVFILLLIDLEKPCLVTYSIPCEIHVQMQFNFPNPGSEMTSGSPDPSFMVRILTGASCSFMQASCHCCLTFCMPGWAILGGGAPWKSTSFPGTLFSAELYRMRFFQANPWKYEDCSLKTQGCQQYKQHGS